MRDTWRNVNEKHDAYVVSLPDDEASSEADQWINDMQKRFYEVQERVNAAQAKIKSKLLLEGAKHNRDIAYANFRQLCLKFEGIIAMNIRSESIERERSIIQTQFTEVKMKHNKLLAIDGETIEHQEWLSKLIKELSVVNKLVDDHIQATRINSDSTIRKSLQLEKFPLPKFEGDIRSYPTFRRDFVEMILPIIDKKQSSFVLRKCLSKDIEKCIASCEEDVDVILRRLDDKYGDPSRLTDTVINDIKKFRCIEIGDAKRLIQFIDIIESGYNDLKVLSLEGEVCNSNIVSIIESKLPRA